MADPADREHWGRRVRELWVQHQREHPPLCGDCYGTGEVAAHYHGVPDARVCLCERCTGTGRYTRAVDLLPWEWLPQSERERCRVIGEAIAREAAAREREACLALARERGYAAARAARDARSDCADGHDRHRAVAEYDREAGVADDIAAAIRVRGSEGR